MRKGRQPSAASAIDRGAGTSSKRTLPAGTIQVITSIASRPARTAGSSLLSRRAVSGSHVMIEMPRRRSSSFVDERPSADEAAAIAQIGSEGEVPILELSRLVVREVRCVGPTHEQHERVPVELHAAN